MKIWNGNLPEFPDVGINRFALDYSIDGENWINLAEYDIPGHTPSPYYEGDDIEGIMPFQAQQVLITAIHIKGGTCTGLSEVRFYRGGTTTSTTEINKYEYEVYPNPSSHVINVDISDESFTPVLYEVFDINGQMIEKRFTNDRFIQLNIERYNSGHYLIKVSGADDQIITEKIQFIRS